MVQVYCYGASNHAAARQSMKPGFPSPRPERTAQARNPVGQEIPLLERRLFSGYRMFVSSFLFVFLIHPSALHTQPAAPNRVLDLDGVGDFVRLPPAGFTNFHQATIEAWVKWRGFSASARVFDFGARQREMYLGTATGGILPNSA